MPVLRFKTRRLMEELETSSVEELLELLETLKGEASYYGDWVEVEFELDRPDLYTVEGIRRAARGLKGVELGVPKYNLVETDYAIYVDDVVSRPYIAGAVIWDVDVDEDFIEELIQFQEKLHQSHGANRARVAIGLHDLDKLPSRKLYYRLGKLDEVIFKPLGYGREMKLREVLTSTEQGTKYGKISLVGDKHPVLYSDDEVISVPPVINAELTRIEPGTRHVFVDVTGTELNAVLSTLYVIAANLAERSRSKRIGMVSIITGDGARKEPQMPLKLLYFSASSISRLLGVELNVDSIVRALEMSRFDARVVDGEVVEVVVPAYRIDVISWVDVAEDIAIVYRGDVLKPRKPRLMLRGARLPYRVFERSVRYTLLGLGFTELYTYTLTSCRLSELFSLNCRPVRLLNPVSAETACFRTSIVQQLLKVVAQSSYRVPVKVFEIGDAACIEDGRLKYCKRIGIAIADRKAGYEDIQAVVYTLLDSLNIEVKEVKPLDSRVFIEGRAAVAHADGLTVYMGEVRPEILVEMGIEYPTAVAEIDYTDLARRWGWAAAVSRP